MVTLYDLEPGTDTRTHTHTNVHKRLQTQTRNAMSAQTHSTDTQTQSCNLTNTKTNTHTHTHLPTTHRRLFTHTQIRTHFASALIVDIIPFLVWLITHYYFLVPVFFDSRCDFCFRILFCSFATKVCGVVGSSLFVLFGRYRNFEIPRRVHCRKQH